MVKYSVIVILFSVMTIFGETYYVDGINGNNNNNGLSEQTAWKTIGNANRLLQAGDLVYIKNGRYTDCIKPVNSGELTKPIIYSRFMNDTVVIDNAAYGIVIENVNYITVKNILFNNIDFYLLIWKGSCHNTIDGCKFDKMRSFVNWAGCRILGNSKYNKIINSSISQYGTYDSLAKGAVLDIGTEASKTDSSFSNLVQNCTLYHGGHHVLGLYSSYNVIKNNYIHNEAWYNGFGERNIILNGHDECSGWNLIESNKIAFAGLPPDSSGGSGIAIVTKNNIIRKNIIYKCNAAGVMLGATSNYATYPLNNKIYNNTILFNGYNTLKNTGGETKCGIGFANYGSSKSINENDIVNNIIYKNGTDKAFGFYKVDSAIQNFSGNWIESDDPLFIDSISKPASRSATIPNVFLQENSPCIDSGTFLTRIASSNGTGKSFQVYDAGYFTDGFGITSSDTIQLENNQVELKIINIDYKTRTITVEKTISWSKDQGVSLNYHGSLPDIGAYEHHTSLSSKDRNYKTKSSIDMLSKEQFSIIICDLAGRKLKKAVLDGKYEEVTFGLYINQIKRLNARNIYVYNIKSKDNNIVKVNNISK